MHISFALESLSKEPIAMQGGGKVFLTREGWQISKFRFGRCNSAKTCVQSDASGFLGLQHEDLTMGTLWF